MIKIFTINFLLAVSTAMGMTLLPIVATENLGISLFILGIIEGSTEFLSNILRMITGNLFDKVKNKRLLFIVPVGLAFVSKGLLLVVLNKYSVLCSKICERLANGAFGSPREAYAVNNADSSKKSLIICLLNSSKTLGCVVGAFLISMSTLWIGSIYDNIVTLISITCLVTIAAFIVAIRIKNNSEEQKQLKINDLQQVFSNLLPIYFLSFLFFLARFNDGILMMFLKNQGFPEWFYLSTISVFNFAMLVISPILGLLIDRKQATFVLIATVASLVAFNAFYYNIALFPWYFAIAGLVCWGLQRAGAAAIFIHLVTTRTPRELTGTALGVLAAVNALGTLISSAIAGYLAQTSFFNVFATAGAISLFSMTAVTFYLTKCFKSKNVDI